MRISARSFLLLFTIALLRSDGQAQNDELNRFPTLKYGTAWKKGRTEELVYQAILSGFRHIDTACQPKHYHEPGVGKGWTRASRELGLSRSDIWLQTKYTSLDGQDVNQPLPYDRNAPLADRVRQSVETSLKNLQTEYIDSLIMHGMESNWEDNLMVWSVFEEFVDAGIVRQIGISNFYQPDAVEYLYEHARIKPAAVQNRFYAETGYDTWIREFCRTHAIEYQSFWTLGANRHFSGHSRVRELASEKGLSPETLLYAFVMQVLSITPLDGTTNKLHMKEDMALLQRIRSGEQMFASDEIVTEFAEILGLPDWETREEL